MTDNIFQPGKKFCGWYDAPFPFGRTEFNLEMESFNDQDQSFSGTGNDKQGEFKIQGKLSAGNKVEFMKSYVDGSHTNIHYEGIIEGDQVSGHYTFCYKTFLINMNIKEKFQMNVC